MTIKRAKRLTIFPSLDIHGVQTYVVFEITNSLEWHPGDALMPSEVKALIERDPSWTVTVIENNQCE